MASARAYLAAINRMLACDPRWSWRPPRENDLAITAAVLQERAET